MRAALHAPSPISLIGSHLDSEAITLPTGASVFRPGEQASAIYALKRGIMELIGERGEKSCYRPGELFSYEDIIWRDGCHHSTAVARTPVEILRLDRLHFLNLLHNHPTLAILLISQQHARLREQRSSGANCY